MRWLNQKFYKKENGFSTGASILGFCCMWQLHVKRVVYTIKYYYGVLITFNKVQCVDDLIEVQDIDDLLKTQIVDGFVFL